MGNIPLQMRQAKAAALREATECWKADHDEAMAAYTLEDIVQQSLSIPDDLRAIWDYTMTALEGKDIDDFDEIGRILFEGFAILLHAIENLHRAAVDFVNDTGHTIARLDEQTQAVEESRRLVEEYRKTWPWSSDPWPAVNHERIDAAMAAFRRGEFLTIEEAIHEAQQGNLT